MPFALRLTVRFIVLSIFMLSLAVALLMVASPTFASTVDTPVSSPVTFTELSPQMVAGLISSLVPLLVSLLARSTASDKVKVVLNLALTAVVASVAALVVPVPGTDQAEFGWVPFLTAWLYAFITSTIAYLGALKHFDLNEIILQFGGIFGQKPADPQGAHEVGDVLEYDTPEVPPAADENVSD